MDATTNMMIVLLSGIVAGVVIGLVAVKGMKMRMAHKMDNKKLE